MASNNCPTIEKALELCRSYAQNKVQRHYLQKISWLLVAVSNAKLFSLQLSARQLVEERTVTGAAAPSHLRGRPSQGTTSRKFPGYCMVAVSNAKIFSLQLSARLVEESSDWRGRPFASARKAQPDY